MPNVYTMETSRALTQRIIRARNNIRRKCRELRRMQNDSDLFFKTQLGSPLQDVLKKTAAQPTTTAAAKRSVTTQTLLGEPAEEEEEEDIFTPVKKKKQVAFVPTTVVAETPHGTKNPSLTELMSTPEYTEQLDEFLIQTYGARIAPFIEKLFSKKTDTTYGIRYEGDRFLIGNSKILLNDDELVVKGIRYKPTDGLLELLFSRFPDTDVITETDELKYRDILQATHAHRREYDEDEAVNANRSSKYRNFIAKLFPVRHSSARGLAYKPLLPYIDIQYWNDPNELVQRLHLLLASRHAGHTGHDAEIQEIEDELRAANIIA